MSMKVDGGSKASKSHRVEERKPPEPKVETPAPKKLEPSSVRNRLNKDGFEAGSTKPQAQFQNLLGGTTAQTFQPGPVANAGGTPLAQNTTVRNPGPVAQGGPVGQGGTQVSPEVQAAIDEINEFQPQAQGIGLSIALSEHNTNSPEDVAFRRELMNALGADRVAEMMGHVREDSDNGPGLAVNILSAASEAYSPADQGKLVQSLGSEMLGRTLAEGVEYVSNPNAVNPDYRTKLENVAKMLGTLHSQPAGSPGKAEAAGALERIQNGEQYTSAPGVSTAAWLVAHAGSDALKNDFANKYLDEFKANPESLSPEEARAVAWALGSTTGSPSTGGMGPIVNLTHEQRTQFLDKLTTSERYGAPDVDAGANFQADVRAGVNEFLMDVSRINPANFGNTPEARLAARELRIETFQKVSKAVDGDFFAEGAGTHRALANMFAADTEGIVNTSANTSHRLHDREGQALAKFFDHVAFRSEGSREKVTQALQKYLGVGNEQGIVDELAASKGNDAFMADRGNILARNMGFLLGALYQGAEGALKDIGDEHARKKAIVDVMGSLVETAIEASPVSGAYSKIKSGTGDRASVDAVFNWLGDKFAGDVSASKDAVTKLAGSIIEGAWAPFFGDEALQGANPGDLTDMFELINAGVSLADGRSGQPNINIGGAYING
ncbi:hypothetical protein HPC49_48735 [Pyxidicoccus fallax]|uniref:Uncharacterized protein n=1 Tax=Pyxidicoccus fallax TaxID=394095 RepID=A0A848L938_9BACT|nr:hypothetical protein [Pyxidicoccus fallax]NMO13365.1 hypothetical protein [Pyxidicoccus fallax]NPC86059.1 hypothetical protein [Pyxidicoccus fallax]